MSTQFAVLRRSTRHQYGAQSSSPIQPICISFDPPTPSPPARSHQRRVVTPKPISLSSSPSNQGRSLPPSEVQAWQRNKGTQQSHHLHLQDWPPLLIHGRLAAPHAQIVSRPITHRPC
ncbi:hypothetical protein ACLOJK_014961 [Asimina triloba]